MRALDGLPDRLGLTLSGSPPPPGVTVQPDLDGLRIRLPPPPHHPLRHLVRLSVPLLFFGLLFPALGAALQVLLSARFLQAFSDAGEVIASVAVVIAAGVGCVLASAGGAAFLGRRVDAHTAAEIRLGPLGLQLSRASRTLSWADVQRIDPESAVVTLRSGEAVALAPHHSAAVQVWLAAQCRAAAARSARGTAHDVPAGIRDLRGQKLS